MTRNIVALIGVALLAGCSGGGGGDPATSTSAPTPSAQPDMLVATSDGLWRGKATGNGQLISARPGIEQPGAVFVSEGNVYYHRLQPVQLPAGFELTDIWTVHTDGTDDHALVNTIADETARAAADQWIVYEHDTFPNGTRVSELRSVRGDTGQQALLATERFTQYRFLSGQRAVFNTEQRLFSSSLNGTDARTHAIVNFPLTLSASGTFDNTLIYREFASGTGRATLKSITVSGGSLPVSLDDGLSYVSYVGHVGSSVVYQRCVIEIDPDDPPRAGACDVDSVNTDGSRRAVLASHSANESVQGFIGDQVIIRRNLSGNDQLIAVPVTGGTEQLLMTMTDSEFVQLIVDDLLIVRRPSGTWTLGMNGTLTKIGSVAGDFGVMAVGDSICLNKGTAVWCMPQDGQGPQVKIVDRGKVVGVL